MQYEDENDIPTIEDKDTYYYGKMEECERNILDDIDSPAGCVSELIHCLIDEYDRSPERDIAEMRRLVGKFMKTEEWIVICLFFFNMQYVLCSIKIYWKKKKEIKKKM